MQEEIDQQKVKYFQTRYSELEGDELNELNARRETLADEAVVALDSVLKEKGISTALIAKFQPVHPVPSDEVQQAAEARELFRGGLSVACQVVGALVIWTPVQTALRNVSLGAVFMGLIALVTLWFGSMLGKKFVRQICQDGETTLAEKRKSLWILLGCELSLMILIPGLVATVASK